MSLLATYVARHNEGVRKGSFAALGELFTEDAEVHFDGLPVGPFIGRVAILQAFATRPPDDELVLFAVEQTATGERADYGWQSVPDRIAGSLDLTLSQALIEHLRVSARPE